MAMPTVPVFPALSAPTAAQMQQLTDAITALMPLYGEVPSGLPNGGVTFTSTTLGSVLGLNVTVAQNCTYVWEAHLFYTAGRTEGLDVRMLFPSLAKIDQGTQSPWNTDPGLNGGTHADIEWYSILDQSSPAATRDIGGCSTGLVLNAVLKGRLKTGATGGSLTLQAAQHTGGGTATIIKTGSYLHVRRVA
jgi:hypothetical protein